MTLTDTGSNTALSCQITTGSTCSYSGSVSVSAGDRLAWAVAPANSPTAQTSPPPIIISALFTANSGVNQGPIMMASNGAVSATNTNYIGPGGSPSPAGSAAEINVSGIVPVAGAIESIWAIANGSPGTAGSQYYKFTIYHNGASTSLTCQVNNPSASSACNSSANPITVAAGDTISCGITPTGTPTARVVTCGFAWQPSATGQALVFANGRTSPPTTGASSTEYYNIAGFSSPGTITTESTAEQLSPNLPSGGHTLTFGNLVVAQSTTPTSNSRTTTLRAGAASPSNGPSCQITTTSTGTIGGVTGVYNCADTHTYQSASGTLIDMQTSDLGSGGTTPTWFKSTMTAVYQ